MKKTTLRLRKDLHTRLKVRAVEQERQMQELLNEAVEQYLGPVAANDRKQG